MDNIKNGYALDMSTLVNQLRVKAGVIEMGESIVWWGNDTELMRDAADRIEKLEEIVKAVACIGVDFSYHRYVLQPEYVDKARELLNN